MKKIISIIIAALYANALLAAEIDFKAGPWITNIGEDEATIMWVTRTSSLGWVEIGEYDGSTFYCTAKQQHYQTLSGRRVFGTFHQVTVKGLKPGTDYIYRIVSKKISDRSSAYDMRYEHARASKPATFTTLDHSAKECRFSMVNDMHFQTSRYAALTKDVTAKNCDFLFLNGDIVSFSSSLDTLVSMIFGAIPDKVSTIPVMSARGNHESRDKAFEEFNRLFPSRTGELYYTFRQGPVAFVVLDAGEDKPDSDVEYFGTAEFDPYREQEAEWLKQAVKEPEFASAPVKICLMHIPTLYEKGAWYAQRRIHELFTPILNEAGIDLMLSGHHHRHFVVNPHEKGDADYTIIVNSNTERMDVFSDGQKTSVRTYDESGALTHSYDFTF